MEFGTSAGNDDMFNTNIVRLDRAIVDARTYADTTAAAHAEGKIKDHRGELDEARRADLRVVAYGVVISMVGIVLAYLPHVLIWDVREAQEPRTRVTT